MTPLRGSPDKDQIEPNPESSTLSGEPGELQGKDQVSRLCQGLDDQVAAFRDRPLGEARYPYLWLDPKVERVREPGGVRQKCLVIAYGVHHTGRREVLGIHVGECETESFWREFLPSLRARGLTGVKLCVSDAPAGLKAAIGRVLGCPWQRCTVHFLRDMLGHVGRPQQPMVAPRSAACSALTITPSPRGALRGRRPAHRARPKSRPAARRRRARPPRVLRIPAEHWSKLRSTNPLERVNREIAQRCDVIGIFPNDAALLRPAGALRLEQNDE